MQNNFKQCRGQKQKTPDLRDLNIYINDYTKVQDKQKGPPT